MRMAQSPSVATRIALIVCMRFSACSKAMLHLRFEDLVGDFEPVVDAVSLGDLLADRGLGVVERRQAMHELDLRDCRWPASAPC